jgi:hypothetical protein
MRLFVALLCLLPALASADEIPPFEGECPPGSGRGIRDHAEACVPSACAGDGDCGEGARCVAVFECWAERAEEEAPVVRPTPRLVPMVVGACDAERRCAEGACRERRQCEPSADTPAWDRAAHRWTGEPHVGPSGCSAGRSGGGVSWSLAVLLVVVGRRAWR